MKRMHFHPLLILAWLFGLALAVAVPVQATTIVDTSPFYNTDVVAIGQEATQVYGQTFTAPTPTDTVLDSFAVHLLLNSGTNSFAFRFDVTGWDGSKATGGPLYQSDPVTALSNGEYSFNTGELNLTYGTEYVAFLETLLNGQTGTARLEASSSNPYSGGSWVYLDNESGITSQPWVTTVTKNTDLVFRAEFSSPPPAPEPGSKALLAVGGLPLLGLLRRRGGA